MGEHAGVRRAPCSWAVGKMAPCRAGAAGATEDRRRRRGRPREAHAAAHLRIVPVDVRSKAYQPPELRLVTCGLPHGLAHRVAHRVRRAYQAFARSSPADSGGHARGSAVTLGRRRRALRRGAHVQLAHRPLGARVAAAAVARGRVEDARSDHGAQSRLPQCLAPEAPSRWYGVVWVCEAAGSRGAERVRSRPSGSTRALGNPPLALHYRQLLGGCETAYAQSVKSP
jgi:hypothetical protein